MQHAHSIAASIIEEFSAKIDARRIKELLADRAEILSGEIQPPTQDVGEASLGTLSAGVAAPVSAPQPPKVKLSPEVIEMGVAQIDRELWVLGYDVRCLPQCTLSDKLIENPDGPKGGVEQ